MPTPLSLPARSSPTASNLLVPELPAALDTGFQRSMPSTGNCWPACVRCARLCDGLYTRNDCSGCSAGQRQLCDNNWSACSATCCLHPRAFSDGRACDSFTVADCRSRPVRGRMPRSRRDFDQGSEIVCALDPQRTVVPLLRELDRLLRRWLENHIQMRSGRCPLDAA